MQNDKHQLEAQRDATMDARLSHLRDIGLSDADLSLLVCDRINAIERDYRRLFDEYLANASTPKPFDVVGPTMKALAGDIVDALSDTEWLSTYHDCREGEDY